MKDRTSALLLQRIAQALGVSVDSILDYRASEPQSLTDEESSDLAYLKVLFDKITSPSDRERVLTLARQLADLK